MRYVRLIAVTDEYDTSPGLALKGTPVHSEGFMADRDGILIAHDLLEHVNGREFIGTVWDELEALGAIWQVRGRHADFLTKYGGNVSPTKNVAADVSRMYSDWTADPMPPARHRLKATRSHLYDDDFREIIAHARHDILAELDSDERHSPVQLEYLQRYLDEALHRMRNGFRKAERKYGEGYRGHTLFRLIRDAVATAKPDFEGQEFTLAYDDERAYVQEVWEREY